MSELPCIWWAAMLVCSVLTAALVLVIWLLDRDR